jgi:Spondin_N
MYKQLTFTLALAAFSGAALAQPAAWEIKVTNNTPAQTFTPLIVMAHSAEYDMFEVGQPASEALEAMAEGGDTGPLAQEAEFFATSTESNGALLGPGESTSVVVKGRVGQSRLSLAGMLLPTNDTFIAIKSAPLPRFFENTHMVPAYDAGTEDNDQSCQHIPGPLCGGEAISASGGEGFVHISNGFHDLGSEDAEGFEVLSPITYDWRNPVATVRVRRID